MSAKEHIETYNYHLPDDRIAKHPLEKRDDSKILVYKSGEIEDKKFHQLAHILEAGTHLVFNDSKVINARFFFQKPTGSTIEIFCLEPHMPKAYELNLSAKKEVVWQCMIGNKKKWKGDVLELKFNIDSIPVSLYATLIDIKNNLVKLSWDEDVDFGKILDTAGQLPIPPYLNRDTESEDYKTYQTVYAKEKGSVAAPTAGLHFTKNVFKSLNAKNITESKLTLHVGAGTFRPVTSEHYESHEMHGEWFEISLEQLNQIIEHREQIISVGTTSTRVLESLYWLGVKLITTNEISFLAQWDWKNLSNTYSVHESLIALRSYLEKMKTNKLMANTSIMIVPGYQFKLIKGLVTNFHQPKSTLMLLISALVGDDWKRIYDHALSHNYRFLSYGDSSILIP